VLLGTLYPLIVDAFGLGKISVGPPYFNAVFLPIMLPLLVLVAIGPVARWKHADLKAILFKLWPAAVAAVLAGAILPILAGEWHAYVALALALVGWMVTALVLQSLERLKAGSATPSWWGMQLAHFGLAVFVVGVAMVGTYEEERDVRMEHGDTVLVGGYDFKFLGVREADGPNYRAAIGSFELSKNGKLERILHPEKRDYQSSSMPMTEAAIDASLTRDVYVSLGEPLSPDKENGPWAVRVYFKPFVDWIWGGCFLMALGGIVAAADRRYRLKVKAPAVTTTQAGASA
jgi:cytochrome c-type biogenesis protein CcmF